MELAVLLDSYRAASEDRAEVVALLSDTRLIIVADGVGGRPLGGEAATRAVAFVRDAAQTATPKQCADAAFWARILTGADDAVCADDACGETALIAVCQTQTRLAGAVVGDCEAWWIDDGTAQKLTDGATRKPFLGYGAARPTPFALPLPATGTLLVASDGLFKYVDEGAIAAIVSGDTQLAKRLAALRDAARGSSGNLYDDFAAVLLAPFGRGRSCPRIPPLFKKPKYCRKN